MTMRWQERRVEDDLLKRELLLRLRAAHRGLPGSAIPASDHFRSRVRRMLLRHPIFAFKYCRLAIELGLGRNESRDFPAGGVGGALTDLVVAADLDTQPTAPARGGVAWPTLTFGPHGADMLQPAPPRRAAPRRGRQFKRNVGLRGELLVRRFRSAIAVSLAQIERQSRALQTRVIRLRPMYASTTARVQLNLRRRRSVVHARLIHARTSCGVAMTALMAAGRRLLLFSSALLGRMQRACRAALLRTMVELRRQSRLLHAILVRLARTTRRRLSLLVVELRLQSQLMSRRLGRVVRACGAALVGFGAERKQQGRRALRRLVSLQQGCRAALARLVAEQRQRHEAMRRRSIRLVVELKQQTHDMLRRLIRRQEIYGAAAADLLSALWRQRSVLPTRLIHIERTCSAKLLALAAELRRRRSVAHGRIVHAERTCRRAALAGLASKDRLQRQIPSKRAEWFGSRPHIRAGRRTRAALAFGGVLTAVALAGASAVVATHRFQSGDETSTTAATKPRTSLQPAPWHLPSVVPAPAATRTRPPAPKPVQPPTRKPTPPVRTAPAQPTILVSNIVRTTSAPAAPATGKAVRAASDSGGPAPLPAPPGSSAPSPLRAP